MINAIKVNDINRTIFNNAGASGDGAKWPVTTGTILSFNGLSYKAGIEINNPFNSTVMYLYDVPFLYSSNGMNNIIPSTGDKVVIDFIYGSVGFPVIIGILNNDTVGTVQSTYGTEIPKVLGIL